MSRTYLALDIEDELPHLVGTYPSKYNLLTEWHDSEDLEDMLFLEVKNGETIELDIDEEIKKGFSALDEETAGACCAAAPAERGGFAPERGGFLSQ